jgi:hypothetical protein
MSLEYVLEHGSYVLYDMDTEPSGLTGNREILHCCDEVAIAFDRDSGTLHKHGDPARVMAWADQARAKLRQVPGGNVLADALVVISGKLPLEEVNKCLAITGYCAIMARRLQAGAQLLGASHV